MTAARQLGVAAALVIATVLLSRLLGFVRDAVIAALFGATGATDAFVAAFTIPDFLNYIVAGATLSITFIPIYSRYLASGREEEGNRVFSIIATTMTLVLIAGTVLLEIWAPEITRSYLSKLRPEHQELAIRLTRIVLPAQIFFYLGGLGGATLYARQRFVAASLAPLIYNLGTILGGALLGRRLGIAALAWGTLAGCIVGPFGIVFVAAWRAGARWRPSLAVTDPGFREWLLRTLPLMAGVSLVMADEWFIRYFAAAALGAISCLSYARKLAQVPIAVAGQAVGAASMPFFARLWAEGRRAELGALVTRSARASATASALLACGLGALAEPAVELLFRRGHFAAAAVAPTAGFVRLFALAIPFWAMQGILSRAFYAAGDTLLPMGAGTLVTLAMAPVYYGLYQALGADGLALASDCGIALHTAALLLLLPRRVPECDRRGLLLATLRSYALGALAGVPTYFAVAHLPYGALTGHRQSLFALVVGGIVFLTLSLLLSRPLGAGEATALFERLGVRLWRRLARPATSRPST